MTGSLDEKAWIFYQKGPAQTTKEPVFIQPMNTRKTDDSCTKAVLDCNLLNPHKLFDVMRANHDLDWVYRMQQKIIKEFPEIENRARERGISFGEPPRFELRFIGETFCAVESYSGYNLPLSYP